MRETLTTIREYWRIILLVVMLVASTGMVISFDAIQNNGIDGEAGVESTDATDGSPYFNLKYGLELAGGTSVRAPLVGVSATDVQLNPSDRSDAVSAISDELGIESFDVRIRYEDPEEPDIATVEIYQEIDPVELGAALEETSADTTDMELSDDVSEATYDEAQQTLDARISESGLSGGDVTQAVSADQTRYLVVSVPNENQEDVLELIERRGLLRIVGLYPEEMDDGTVEHRNETIVTQADVHSVGQIDDDGAGVGVPVTLTDAGAERYVGFLDRNGFLTDEGTQNCRVGASGSIDDAEGYCLLTFQDDTYLHGGGIAQGLATEMNSGNFEQSPTVVLTTTSRSEAQQLQVTLRAGAMPTSVDISSGTVQFLSPSQASEFKVFSLIIGILTVVAVALAVAYRYRDPVVAAPMTLTAMSEIWILLGFVALVQLPLDLSHIAGLIAVVGTGVDDLIIIADEVLAGGDVSTKRVFESRFKKAFWVIGVAAVTTIIAMSPLAFLSLGDLQGFAIVTIVGILIGVLVTRPAYGDILKYIVERRQNH